MLSLFAFFFGTPLSALLVGLSAAALPVVVHLLNRKRYRVVDWAAMRFLLAAQRKHASRMRLEQFLLLAVRTLIVLLLVLAMSSVMPWSDGLWARAFPGLAMRTAAGARRTHKILVLDGTFSMGAKPGDTTFFDKARTLAARVVSESPAGDGFSVLLLAAPPRRIVGEASENAASVVEELRALRLPQGYGALTATLTALEDMLRESPDKFEAREVYFITDLQRSTWLAHQSGDAALMLQKVQARSRVIFLDVGQEGLSNTAVTGLTVGVPFATTVAATPILASLHNFGTAPRKQVRVELLVGRARSASNSPPFALQEVQQTTFDLQPGQNTVSFSYRFPVPGDFAIGVRAEGDVLDLDDARWAILTVQESVPVILVNGKPAVELYDRATEWARDALNPFPSGLPVPRNVPARPRVLTVAQFADASLGDLSSCDCVFLCDVPRLSESELRRLDLHLRRGGGVVFALGPNVDLEDYNRLIYRKGEGLLPARLLGVQAASEGEHFIFHADDKTLREPPLAAFGAEPDRLSLLAARFRSYVRAEQAGQVRARKILAFMPEASVPGGTTQRTGRQPTLKTGPRTQALPVGDPALLEMGRYRGRVLLFTSSLNMDWNTWPISPSFPPFMQELLHHAVAGRLREQATLVGEILEEYLQPGEAGLPATFYLPDGRVANAQTALYEDVGILRWTDTPESGIYRGTIGDYPLDHLFAVNVPATNDSQQACESDLERTNLAELQSAYPNSAFQLVTDLGQIEHAQPASFDKSEDRPVRGMGRIIARWILLTMLGLIVLEVVLAWGLARHGKVAGGRFAHGSRFGARYLPALGGQKLGDYLGMAWAAMLFLFIVLPTCGILLHAFGTGDFLGFLSDGVRGSVEDRLGIPPPAAGEEFRWHLEFAPYFLNAASDPWLAASLALGVSALVFGIYLREGKVAATVYGLLLAGLRVSLVLLVLGVFLPQLQLSFERRERPDVAILIDDSRSMSATDVYQNEEIQEAAARLGRELGLSTPERLQLAQGLLTRPGHAWLERLLTSQRVKIHIYHCSSRAARVVKLAESRQLETATSAILSLRPDGESSQLGAAVRQVLNDFRGASLAAVVMLTDGVTTEGEDLGRVARYAAQSGVPLFLVGIGSAQEVRDLKLHDLQVEDSVYAGDNLIFEARLTAQGYSEPRSVMVTLFEKGEAGGLKPLAHVPVTTDPDGKPVKFRLTHKPTVPGERTFVLEVPEQPDEVKPADNNRLERTVRVREARLIKVLYIEGYARYEYRFVKNLLERESSRDRRNKSIDLKVLLLDADSEYAAEDRSALGDFPTIEELNNFDVVLLGDVDPKDPRLGEKHLHALVDFVKERGGGLLMIAGDRFSPQAYSNSALRDIMPIQPTGAPQPDGEYKNPYRPELTGAGRFHAIFRFSPDEAENRAIWSRLAEVYWWSEGFRVQPAAEVLMVHPRRPAVAAAGAPAPDKTGLPLLVQQFVGAGRCMFLGIDETWRWRLREDELRFNQFWIQIVRYLARSRTGRVELRVDRQTPYRRGEPIKVTVRFPDDAPPPAATAPVEVVALRTPLKRTTTAEQAIGETEQETLRLHKIEGARATYEGMLSRTPPGEYRFTLSVPPAADFKPHAEARVLPPPGEMELLRMNQPDMERAAEESHGHFYTLASADRLFDDFPGGTRVVLSAPQPPLLLWNHPAVFAVALVLLGSEWVLRRRRDLL
jgi:hypothetical protein